MSSVLRPEVPSWKRSEEPLEPRWWLRDDADPEQVAREAIAELEGAIGALKASLELLGSPRPNGEPL